MAERVSIGRAIVDNRPDVYTEALLSQLKATVARFSPEAGDDVFYLTVFDYWLYGFTADEEFYLGLVDKTSDEKERYMSHMGRLNYMMHLNTREGEHLLRDKWMTYKLLHEHYGREVECVQSPDDFPKFEAFCSRHPVFVAKPRGGAISLGVQLVEVGEREDAKSAFERLLQEMGVVASNTGWIHEEGMLIEEPFRQGAELSRYHEPSINSVRLTTLRTPDGIHIFYPVLRIGKSGNFLCCGAVGSILTGINLDIGVTETVGRNELGERFETHPDSGYPIAGIEIPEWETLCEKAIALAGLFPNLGYIGWDFVWNDEGKWCVMEANENGEFLGQIAYQSGLKSEFEDLIGWKPESSTWWKGRY